MDEADDDLFRRASALVIHHQKASTSFVQRQLDIGYNRAARLMERMEDAGIVSKPNAVGKREVATVGDIQRAITISRATAGLPEEERKAITASVTKFMREADTAARAKQGKPPMKPDPTFDQAANNAYAVTADELRQFIERWEQLDAEKKDIADQQKEVMSEAKGRGYDTKVMRKVIALRKRKPDDIAEEEAVLDIYKAALGMV